MNEDRLVDCTESSAKCTFLALRGSTFTDNEALLAGGALLASDLNSIRVVCSHAKQQTPLTYVNRSEFEALAVLNSRDNICQSWRHNTAGGYGDDLATYGRQVRKVIRFDQTGEEQEVEGNIYFLQSHLSGSPLPSLFLTVVDRLGQGPAIGDGNQTVVARMRSPDGLFTGSVRIRLENGHGNFSGISGYRDPGLYDVRVDFASANIPPFTLLVEVRRCRLGEAAVANGTVCQRCSGDSFNFLPDRVDASCEACPEGAKCDEAVIRPRKGLWHGSPCSRHIQECLTQRACDDEGRDETLKEIGRTVRSCNFTAQFLEEYRAAECRKVMSDCTCWDHSWPSQGYRGPLCGSCDKDFGRSSSFRCEPCFKTFRNFILLLLPVLVLLLLSSFTVRSSLPSHGQNQKPTSSQQAGASTSGSRISSVSSSSSPANTQTTRTRGTGHVPAVNITSKNHQPPQNPQNISELTKWKALEIFKVHHFWDLAMFPAAVPVADHCQLPPSHRRCRLR